MKEVYAICDICGNKIPVGRVFFHEAVMDDDGTIEEPEYRIGPPMDVCQKCVNAYLDYRKKVREVAER